MDHVDPLHPAQPAPGGPFFSEAIPRTAFAMADLVGTTTQQQMLTKLDQITNGISGMSSFSFLHVRDFVTYLVITLLIALLELAMFIVIGFGYLALGAVLVIGPILIPFMIVPKLDFLFWSWLKALIKYSFYPGYRQHRAARDLPDHAFHPQHHLPTSGPNRYQLCFNCPSCRGFAAGLYAIFKIPSLVQDIFSGSASAGGGLQAAITGSVMKAF